MTDVVVYQNGDASPFSTHSFSYYMNPARLSVSPILWVIKSSTPMICGTMHGIHRFKRQTEVHYFNKIGLATKVITRPFFRAIHLVDRGRQGHHVRKPRTNELRSTTDEIGRTENFGYDTHGHVTIYTGKDGLVTTQRVDDDGRRKDGFTGAVEPFVIWAVSRAAKHSVMRTTRKAICWQRPGRAPISRLSV